MSDLAESRNVIVGLMDKKFEVLKRALPANVNPARFRQAAIMAAAENPRIILECTPASVFTAILQAAQLGYNLGSAYNEAYLVPYRDKRRGVTECKLTPGYIGMRRALIRSGVADVVHASIVHENDNCVISHHPPSVKHSIDLKGDRGGWLGVLACAYRLTDGVHQLIDFEYLSENRILAAKSQSRDQSLWDKHPEQFWKKTGIRALVKLFPLVNDELVTMVSWDNDSNLPIEEQAATTPQDTAARAASEKELPPAEVLPPPPESPQATAAKKKTRKKKAVPKKVKPTNGKSEVPFGF